MQHIFPINDCKEHNFYGMSCPCGARLMQTPYGEIIMVHNAFDFRDMKESLETYQRNAMRNVMASPNWNVKDPSINRLARIVGENEKQ